MDEPSNAARLSAPDRISPTQFPTACKCPLWFVLDKNQRWTPSAGQLIDVAKWNLLRYIPVKMRGAEDDKEETAKPFASL